MRAAVSVAHDAIADVDRLEVDALARNIKTNFQQVVSLSPLLSDDLQTLAMNIHEPWAPGRLHRVLTLDDQTRPSNRKVLETLTSAPAWTA